ncbi:MAG: 50S ribosomal protein L30 [Alphaproteobacteria bacterium]|nr:50S ribosomal protein L30 [Alphaproteobacteria bacterium]
MTAKAQTKKAAPSKSSGGKTLIVTQIAGSTGKGPKKFETLKGLGLGRIRSSRELQDTPEVRGMITSVRHLVTVEEKKG